MSHQTMEQRTAAGTAARDAVPLASHADWSASAERSDPIELLQSQNAIRVPWLVPLRHYRMSANVFAFYRGTAKIMAADLASSPVSGLDVQVIGDGHLANFGAYASPERRLVFDANDFDETLKGPWEWDLKRLATSFVLGTRHIGYTDAESRRLTGQVVQSYREAMAEFATKSFIELWYDHVGVDDLKQIRSTDPEQIALNIEAFADKARRKNSLQALGKLTTEVEGRFQIKAQHPVLVPIREIDPDLDSPTLERSVREAVASYIDTLRDDRQTLLRRYQLVDIAFKVVGVGSVGTRCYILLFEGRDSGDPLFLQAKEATASVLEDHLGPSPYPHHGQRVVEGQRQIQAQSDIFLGWTTGGRGVHYYFRQLRDWKRSFNLENAAPPEVDFYSRFCGITLARGHARSGDPAAISGYMGETTELDDSITEFAVKYADQTETDYETFLEAIGDGVLESRAD